MKKNFVNGLVLLSMLAFFPLTPFTGNIYAQEPGPNNYILIFQAVEYDNRLGDAVDYFLNEVLKPEDNLILFTPQRHYNFSRKTRQTTPMEKLTEVTKNVLKRDISVGAATYKDIIQQMEIVIGTLRDPTTTQVRSLVAQYRQLRENLSKIRKLNEKLFLDLANMFKQSKGKNHIFICYQKTIRVIPNRQTMERLRANAEVRYEVNEIFEAESSSDVLDADKVSKALKEAGAKLNFIYLKMKTKRRHDMEVREFSGDVYNVFSKIAKDTGGTVMIASRARAALKKIIENKK